MARSEAPIDSWSVGHFLGGAILGGILRTPGKTFLALVAWELVEQGVLARYNPWWSEGPANTFTDILLGMMGGAIATNGYHETARAVAT